MPGDAESPKRRGSCESWVRERELAHGAEHLCALRVARLGGLERKIGRVERRERLQDVVRLLRDGDALALLEHADRLADARAEEARARLVGVRDQLKGEEHCGGEAVERPPVHMPGHCERRVGEEVWPRLPDHRDQLVGRTDCDFEALRGLGRVDGGTPRLRSRVGVWPVEGKADVEVGRADNHALHS